MLHMWCPGALRQRLHLCIAVNRGSIGSCSNRNFDDARCMHGVGSHSWLLLWALGPLALNDEWLRQHSYGSDESGSDKRLDRSGYFD
jgi:hypothetical protein